MPGLFLGSATQTSPGVSLFAPSGGGGGGGGGSLSSITVSTIGFPAANLPNNQAVITMTDKLFFTDFQPQQGTDFTMSCGDTSGVPGSVSTANAFVIFDPVINQTYLSLESLSTQTNIVSRDITGPGATGVPLNVVASVVNISSLKVSSINNAAPGGGGGPNPQVSTLSVNDTGNVLMTWNNGGATLNFGFEATNTSSFIIQQGIGVVGTKVAGPEGCLQVLEKDGGANQVFAPLQASGFEVCATAYPGGAFAGLYFSSIGSVLYSAVGQPLTIDAPAGVSVSSLTVSSINGATPGGGSAIQFSTLKIPGGAGTSTFACDPAITTQLVEFSTLAGHVYSASVQARAQIFETAGNGNVVYTEILDTNTGNDPIGSWPAQSISTLSAGANYQQIGGSVTWKAGGTGASFSIYPDVSTIVRVDGMNLIDFGAV